MSDIEIEVTKYRIKKAIKTEPLLKAGHWVNWVGDRESTTVGDKKNCSVCAVGAVLREVLDDEQKSYMIDSAAETCINSDRLFLPDMAGRDEDWLLEKAAVLCDDKAYMNGLSTYFEGLWRLAEDRANDDYVSRHQVYRIRQKLLKFVTEHFPAKIILNINTNGYRN